MLLRPAEFTHASEKFEFTAKEFGASGAGRSFASLPLPVPLRRLGGSDQSARSSLNVIRWRHAIEYGSLKLASLLLCYFAKPMILYIQK